MSNFVVPSTPTPVTITQFNGKTSAVTTYDGLSLTKIAGANLNAIVKAIDNKIASLEAFDQGIPTSVIDDISDLTLNYFTGNTTLTQLLDDIDSYADNLSSGDVSNTSAGYTFLATGSATVAAVLADIDSKLAALAGTQVSVASGGFATLAGATVQAVLADADTAIDTLETASTSQAASITALQNADQTQSNTLTAGGGTINLDPASNKIFQYITGTATLSSSWTIQVSGTPADGDEFYLLYDAAITLSGNNVTIFGTALTAAEALGAKMVFHAKYVNSTWRYTKFTTSDWLFNNTPQNNTVTSTTTTPYTASVNEVVLMDATAGNKTVNLPAASTASGKEITVKKVDASGNTVTIDGNGSETIDGATTKVISSQWDSVTMVCNGTAWFIK